MSSIKVQFGPGPERIRNEWFNDIQDHIHSNSHVIESMPSGVIWGCQVTFHDGDANNDPRITVDKGAVISNGHYREIMPQEWPIPSPENYDDKYVWIFVDQDGRLPGQLTDVDPNSKLTFISESALQWPSCPVDTHLVTVPEPAPQKDLAVLGLGYLVDSVWSIAYDTRHFVREKPNGAVLVVGDLDAGADFEQLQQALDYLAACELGKNEVPRHIVVTRNQWLAKPVEVRCSGVTIEGVRELEYDWHDQAHEVFVLWGHHTGDSGSRGESAAIKINGHKDVTIRHLNFVPIGNQFERWCAIHNPGNGFTLVDSSFWNTYGTLHSAVELEQEVTRGTQILRNQALLSQGLFSYAHSEGCLRGAEVRHNFISMLPNHWFAIDNQMRGNTKNGGVFLPYSIDMGINPSHCVNNSIEENVIIYCTNGVRVGRLSAVRSNKIHFTNFWGIVVTTSQDGELSNTEASTEVVGNWINLRYGVSGRAGIWLQLNSCTVTGNTVMTGMTTDSAGVGILHGPENWLSLNNCKRTFIELRSGKHTIQGNTLRFNLDEFPGAQVGATRPSTLGIVMLSTDNRITENGIFNAANGIVVTAGNIVSDNTINACRIGVAAWAYNTISGNRIDWFPDNAWGLMLPYTGDSPVVPFGILAARDNTISSNSLTCNAQLENDRTIPQAIGMIEWPTVIFGYLFQTDFNNHWSGSDSPILAQRLKSTQKNKFGLWIPILGGNTISGGLINIGDYIALAISAMGIEFETVNQPNSIDSIQVSAGRYGYGIHSFGVPMSISNSSVSVGDFSLLLSNAWSSRVSSCLFRTKDNYGPSIKVFSNSVETGVDIHFNNCTMIKESTRAGTTINFDSHRGSINNCAITNYGGPGIKWDGDFGVCGGCWFYTKSKGNPNTTISFQKSNTRWPAIVFKSTGNATSDEGTTQGNLVYGAHMINCEAFGIYNDVVKSPIHYSNSFTMFQSSNWNLVHNPHPPNYDSILDRWTNRVHAESCYYCDLSSL